MTTVPKCAVPILALLVSACLLTACGGATHASGAPAGLRGKTVGSSGKSPFSVEDKAAATKLAPAPGTFLAGKKTVSVLGPTTPADGDINPYAIWPVSVAKGTVRPGDVLVDNFNNQSNNQGTGTTIVDVHPDGKVSTFAHLPHRVAGCPGGVGLTTAMVQLQDGWVIVGSLPTANGLLSTAGRGCLLELSPNGELSGTISGPFIDGPWDATVKDYGNKAILFVTNTLVGVGTTTTGTVDKGDVIRLDLTEKGGGAPKVTSTTAVAGGLPESPNAAALVKGPTGLAIGSTGDLYVADNLANRVLSVPDALARTTSAGDGTTLTSGGQLANPLGLVVAPGGDLLAANATNGKIVEITPQGKQVGEYYADDDIGQDPPGNGDLFDVAINQKGTGVLFVNDGTNTLELLH